MGKDRLSGKLVVILHADVAGSTALVQQDEQLAHERIQDAFQRFRKTIEKYHGRVQELRGDALLAEFERASDAVTAALSFQSDHHDHLEDIDDDIQPDIRIGIALGEVVIADGTVTGAGVVLAQRVEQLAKPGGLCITSAIREALPNRMPFSMDSLGEQALKGFEDHVRVYQVRLSTGESVPPPQQKSHRQLTPETWWQRTAIVVVVVLVAAGVGYWSKYFTPQEEPVSIERMAIPLPDKPSIAVLPFTNMSSDTDQENLVEGVTEDIITELSKLRNLTVIARNSSFSYKGKNIKIQEIGRDLGVGYILDGSVQKADDRLRISVQLVNAGNGHQLWAERFDRDLADIFKLQDEITRQIISALEIRLSVDEQKNMTRNVPDSFEAYDFFLRGQKASVQFSEEAIEQAVEFYRRSIRLDPNYAHAYGALAIARIRQYLIGFTETPKLTQNRALELAMKAAAIDPTSHQIQWSLSYIHMYRREFNEALKAAERAVLLSPNYADGYAMLALIKNNLGQAEESISLIEQAMVLNPHYTWDYIYQLGRAYYTIGEYENAVTFLSQALERNESAGYPRLFLAASYVNIGQIDDAEWEIEQVEMAHPEYNSRSYLMKTMPIGDQILFDRFLNDLVTAGLSE